MCRDSAWLGMSGETIQLDQGRDGELGGEPIAELVASRLGMGGAAGMEDSAILDLDAARIAVTTNSFALDPIFFGNGDLGRLAVCGTVNGLAIRGAVPRFLTLSLVIEDGLPIADLERLLDSALEVAGEACVEIVASGTKVVPGGAVDGLCIDTAGIGEFTQNVDLGTSRVRSGDVVIVTGWLGNHGIHMLSLRESLGFEERVLSDCAPLDGLVWNVLEDYAERVHCMRGISLGGLGGALNEVALDAELSIRLEEHRLPVQRETRTAAGELGVDPLHLANEGSICMFVEGSAAAEVLEVIRWQPQGRAAQIVGTVRERGDSTVTMVRPDGGETTVSCAVGPARADRS
jgi:hydrogenase expression/formation protein HypE